MSRSQETLVPAFSVVNINWMKTVYRQLAEQLQTKVILCHLNFKTLVLTI